MAALAMDIQAATTTVAAIAVRDITPAITSSDDMSGQSINYAGEPSL
jgi:hypothetical protein